MGERKRIIIIDITAEYLPLEKLEFFKLYWLDSWLEVISVVEFRQLRLLPGKLFKVCKCLHSLCIYQ